MSGLTIVTALVRRDHSQWQWPSPKAHRICGTTSHWHVKPRSRRCRSRQQVDEHILSTRGLLKTPVGSAPARQPAYGDETIERYVSATRRPVPISLLELWYSLHSHVTSERAFRSPIQGSAVVGYLREHRLKGRLTLKTRLDNDTHCMLSSEHIEHPNTAYMTYMSGALSHSKTMTQLTYHAPVANGARHANR